MGPSGSSHKIIRFHNRNAICVCARASFSLPIMLSRALFSFLVHMRYNSRLSFTQRPSALTMSIPSLHSRNTTTQLLQRSLPSPHSSLLPARPPPAGPLQLQPHLLHLSAPVPLVGGPFLMIVTRTCLIAVKKWVKNTPAISRLMLFSGI
jgi:hypothetical protein